MVQIFFFFELHKYHQITPFKTVAKILKVFASKIRSLVDIAEHKCICQIKRKSDGKFFLKNTNEHFFVSGLVIKGSLICPQKHSLVVCDGYLKFEEAESIRYFEKNNNNGGVEPCGIL